MSDSSIIQLRPERRRPSEEVLLTVGETAERLKVHPRTVSRWIGQGIIPHVRLGDGRPKAPVRIPIDALDEWWRQRKQAGRP